MTDPALAALTEALDELAGTLQWAFNTSTDYPKMAAAILAHPAMADVARKAAAWERLPGLIDSLYREDEDAAWLPSEFWVDKEPYVRVADLRAAIAAALEQGE